MRHKLKGRQFGRSTGPRKAMYKIIVTDLIRHGRIETTISKSKEIKSICEEMITLGKKGTLHDRRIAAAFITDKNVLSSLFTEIAPKYSDRPGGYTRIIRKGFRPGDGAEIVILELV